MILTCPACGTSYVVKDGAIPVQGRQVRCASCKHSWHQDAEQGSASPQPVERAVSAEASQPPREQAAEPVGEREAVSPSPQVIDEPATEPAEFADADDVFDPAAPGQGTIEPTAHESRPAHLRMPERRPIAHDPQAEPLDDFPDWSSGHDERGGGLAQRRGLLILALILLVAALAAAAWFLAPRDMMARVGLREASEESPLQLMVTSQDRQKLASGNDLVSLSGRVINPTEESQPVPPLQADLRDAGGKLVYSWTIAPPTPLLPPRGSASFNAAELGVPADATSLTLRWAS